MSRQYSCCSVDYLAQAAAADQMARKMLQNLLDEGYVEEYPGHLVKRDEKGEIISVASV